MAPVGEVLFAQIHYRTNQATCLFLPQLFIGARTVEQARDNLLAGGWRLPEEALTWLNTISHLPDRYPESMEKNIHERRNGAVKMPSLGVPLK